MLLAVRSVLVVWVCLTFNITYADGAKLQWPTTRLTEVVKIVQGNETVSHAEYYVLFEGRWRNCYCACIADKYRARGLPVLEGVWVSDERFKELMDS